MRTQNNSLMQNDIMTLGKQAEDTKSAGETMTWMTQDNRQNTGTQRGKPSGFLFSHFTVFLPPLQRSSRPQQIKTAFSIPLRGAASAGRPCRRADLWQ